MIEGLMKGFYMMQEEMLTEIANIKAENKNQRDGRKNTEFRS